MLAKRIRALRIRAGMGQAQLAQILNTSASAVGMYEQGRRTPDLETLVKLSKIFGVSLDYLITGSEFTRANTESKEKRLPDNCPCNTCFWKDINT